MQRTSRVAAGISKVMQGGTTALELNSQDDPAFHWRHGSYGGVRVSAEIQAIDLTANSRSRTCSAALAFQQNDWTVVIRKIPRCGMGA